MNKRSLEFWVGSFIFAGMAVLAAMIIRFGSYDQLRDTYELTAAFNYTDGVIEGAPVRVAGVEVGRVTKLLLTPDKETKVGIVMDIDQNVPLRKNVRVIINSLGIMGEKYVEFQPQTPDAERLKPGDWITGEDPVSIASITSQMSGVVKQVQAVIGDEKTGSKLSQIMDNIVQMTGEPNRENVKVSLANFRAFSENMTTLGDDLGEAAKDQKFSETIGNFRDASASLKAIFEKVESGEGTVGQLIYKTDFYDKMKEFLKDIMENPSKLIRPSKDTKKGSGSFILRKE